MFIGSRKFLGAGGFTTQTATVTAAGSTASGIAMNDGTFPMTAFSGTDVSGHIDSSEANLNFPSVTYLSAGRVLTVDMTAFQTTYRTVNTPEPNRQCKIILAYANAGNYLTSQFNFGTLNVIATITSQVAATYTLSGGTYTHTNNYSTYRIDTGSGESGDLTAYPIRFFTRRRILTTDKTNTFGAGTVGTGLIARYQVTAGAQPVSGSVSITIREG
jgi:hypothetical protein